MKKRLLAVAITISMLGVIGVLSHEVVERAESALISTVDSSIAPITQPTPRKRARADSPRSISAGRNIVFLEQFDGAKVTQTEAEWRAVLTPAEFKVLRQEGTEPAYTGKLTDEHRNGSFHCSACGLAVFSSKAKFDSGTGWPSFYQPIAKENVTEKPDNTLGESRTEIECSRCGSHLGHVFDDGPEPTGLRYCINSVALRFRPSK